MTKTIYLTIDDTPSTDCINKLDFLDQHNIKAVWFAEGRRIDALFESAVEILKRGHILGNHSYSHPHFSEISVETCCEEITITDKIMERVYAAANVEWTHRYFRFPYGDKGNSLFGNNYDTLSEEGLARHTAIQTHLRSLGYTQPDWDDVTYTYFKDAGLHTEADWYWTYDSLDWSPYMKQPYHGIDSPAKVLARLDEDVPNDGRGINYPDSADIVLVHDHATSDSWLQRIIPKIFLKQQAPEKLFPQIIHKLIEKSVVFNLPV